MASPRRPRRGLPQDTRDRLVRATAETYNVHGLAATDVRRIVATAGYATGTFYRHFRDKHEALVAAWEWWITDEWAEVPRVVLEAGSPTERAERLVDLGADIHRRWHGLRVAMLAHAETDAAALASYRSLQRGQAQLLSEFRATIGGPTRPKEADLLVAMTLERILDAHAAGELADLDADWATMRSLLIGQVAMALGAG